MVQVPSERRGSALASSGLPRRYRQLRGRKSLQPAGVSLALPTISRVLGIVVTGIASSTIVAALAGCHAVCFRVRKLNAGGVFRARTRRTGRDRAVTVAACQVTCSSAATLQVRTTFIADLWRTSEERRDNGQHEHEATHGVISQRFRLAKVHYQMPSRVATAPCAGSWARGC